MYNVDIAENNQYLGVVKIHVKSPHSLGERQFQDAVNMKQITT